MSLLKSIIGGDAISAVEAVGNVADKLFTSADEKLTHKEIRIRLAQQPQLAQIEVNKIEASHRSLFVAGGRPFILWICGFGLAFAYLINPVLQWRTGLPGPVLPMEYMMELVYLILGLGSYRTFEKMKGSAK